MREGEKGRRGRLCFIFSGVSIMRKHSQVLAMAMGAVIAAGAWAGAASASPTILFSTTQDFSSWTGNNGGTPVVSTVATVTTPTEGGTVNGVGANSPTGDVAGATGTAGALQITFPNGTGTGVSGTPGSYNLVASGPNISGTYAGGVYTPTAAINAIDSGGMLTFDVKPPTGNTYFLAPLFLVNAPGQYSQLQTTLSSTADANGFYTASVSLAGIPNVAAEEANSYSKNGYGYFNVGVIFNSGTPAGTAAYITNIEVTPTPEPASIGLFGIGAAGLLLLGRKRMAR
jgi:hypothetical protein